MRTARDTKMLVFYVPKGSKVLLGSKFLLNTTVLQTMMLAKGGRCGEHYTDQDRVSVPCINQMVEIITGVTKSIFFVF